MIVVKRSMCGKSGGFSLIELMVVIAVAAVLAVIAYPAYQNYIRQTRLYDAQAAMMDNVQALEKHYMRHFSVKKSSTAWADLPEYETKHFCIRMQGDPKGVNKGADAYTLKAVAKDKKFEPRVLLVNQDSQVFVCESSTSTCDEKKAFFPNPGRADKNCTSW